MNQTNRHHSRMYININYTIHYSAMASKEPTFLEDFNEKFLVCSICSERYKKPKVLPCQHSFCETCLVHLVRKTGKLDCPMCRRPCELPDGGVANLQTNFVLNQMVDHFEKPVTEVSETRKCGSCDRSEATVTNHCLECDVGLCESCVGGHGRLRITRSHRLMAIDEYEVSKSQNPALVQHPVHCSKHNDNQVKFYCDSCDSMICADCTVIDHPNTSHKYRYLEEAAEECKRSLQQVLQDLSRKQKEVLEGTTAAEQAGESLDRHFCDEKTAIKEYTRKKIEKFTQMMEENEMEVLEQLCEVYNDKKETVHAQLKGMKIVEDKFTTLREFTEKLIQYGSNTQVIAARKGMTTQIQELMTEVTKCEVVSDDCMKFIGSDELAGMKSFGVIQIARCKIVSDKSYTRVGDELQAVIHMASHSVTPKLNVWANILTANLKTPYGEEEGVNINIIEEGTFLIKSTLKVDGRHELFVSINGTAAVGSPMSIDVIPRKGLLRRVFTGGSGKRQVNSPIGVIVTKRNDVVICDKCNNRLHAVHFSRNFRKILRVRKATISEPRLAALSKNGEILVSSMQINQVHVCDENYQWQGLFGQDQMEGTSGIAVNSSDGRVYVADYDANTIHIYSSTYTYITSFGEKGRGNGQFIGPYGVCVRPNENVVVADRGNNRTQVFTADGEFLDCFGSRGSGEYQFCDPSGIAADKYGNLYVCDMYNNRVHKFNSQNQFICYVNGQEKLGNPVGICVTDEEPFGKVIVTEFDTDSISIFNQ
ncbi:tripartite motif-containing protein 2-like [Ptychodera flava]|uniref:tripartite motif-containing protein 2-like n=1 Tax=Ptychodera flava TaxID=63121 RepID=UPI00396A450F